MAVQVGELVFKMAADIARLQTDMQKARGTVDNAMQGMKGAASIAKTALAGVGVALTAESFVSMIKGSIDAMDSMYKLAQRTGNTVEALSSLKPAARAAGVDIETAAVSMGKLAKNMLEAADTGKGKAAQAFQELGIKIADANGKLRPTVDVMKDIAEKLSAMDDKTRAVALAQEIFGKSGASLIPMLIELARQGETHASMTTKQAEEAHKFNVQLDEMFAKSSALKREMATGLLPALNDILTALSQTSEKSDSVRSFFEMLGEVMRFVAQAANVLWTVIRELGEGIGFFLALTDRLVHLDFKGMVSLMADYSNRAREISENAAKTAAAINGIKQPGASPAGAGDVYGGGGDIYGGTGVANLTGGSGGNDTLADINKQLGISKDTVREVGVAFGTAARSAIKNTNDWRGAVRGLATDLLRMAARRIADQAGAGISSAVGSIFSSIIGGGGEYVEARAGGGPVSSGSTYLVGENGPELFTPGSSGGITPNGAGGDLHVNIDATGADPAALNRVMGELRALRGSIDGRTVAAMRQYFARRGVAMA